MHKHQTVKNLTIARISLGSVLSLEKKWLNSLWLTKGNNTLATIAIVTINQEKNITHPNIISR
jgi:hypothetical protein